MTWSLGFVLVGTCMLAVVAFAVLFMLSRWLGSDSRPIVNDNPIVAGKQSISRNDGLAFVDVEQEPEYMEDYERNFRARLRDLETQVATGTGRFSSAHPDSAENTLARLRQEHIDKFGYVDSSRDTLPVKHTPNMPDNQGRGLKGWQYKDQAEFDAQWERNHGKDHK